MEEPQPPDKPPSLVRLCDLSLYFWQLLNTRNFSQLLLLLHPEIESHWTARVVRGASALITDLENLTVNPYQTVDSRSNDFQKNCVPTMQFEVVEILAKTVTQQCYGSKYNKYS